MPGREHRVHGHDRREKWKQNRWFFLSGRLACIWPLFSFLVDHWLLPRSFYTNTAILEKKRQDWKMNSEREKEKKNRKKNSALCSPGTVITLLSPFSFLLSPFSFLLSILLYSYPFYLFSTPPRHVNAYHGKLLKRIVCIHPVCTVTIAHRHILSSSWWQW